MSTRANIILKEGEEKLFFYRHSDGYPSGVMPTLTTFVNWMKTGKIRNNLSQCAGWIVILGAIEYNSLPKYETEETVTSYGAIRIETKEDSIQPPTDWKVGAYEPTTGLHGDIEYLYTIDLETLEIKVETASYNYRTDKQAFRQLAENELS